MSASTDDSEQKPHLTMTKVDEMDVGELEQLRDVVGRDEYHVTMVDSNGDTLTDDGLHAIINDRNT